MATVAQLAARTYQEIAWLFVVEGWEVAFTNRPDLVGSGGGSWIGTAHGARTVAFGLEPPEAVKLGIGIVESGLPVDDGLTVTIVDRDGHLISFMQDEPGDVVAERLGPLDDPAPATLLGPQGETVNVWGRHVNGEAIGAAGERRQFFILPGVTMPGLDHAAIGSDEGSLRTSAVRSSARWLEGRMCALYLIRKDIDAGTWPSWQDQYDSGYSLQWIGTLRGATAQSRAWRIECEGPSSLLRRTLNANRPVEWRGLTPILTLEDGEDYMASAFAMRASNGAGTLAGGYSAYQVADQLTSGQTPDQLALEVHQRLQTVAAAAGVDITWSTYQGGEVSLTEDQLTIRVDEDNSGDEEGGILALRMHRKAWLHLGWDLTTNVQGFPLGTALQSEVEVEAQAFGGTFAPGWDVAAADPETGYWTGYFSTCPVGLAFMESGIEVDGGGATRTYRPIYAGGGVSVLHPDAGAEWGLWLGLGPYLEGQLVRPPADATIGSGACDRAGFIAVRGKRKTGTLEDDAEDVYQVARVSWVDSNTYPGTVEPDSSSRAVAYFEGWLDPAMFGSASSKLTEPWAAKGLEWAPLALVGYNTDTPDRAHEVLLRLLLSTGTATWSGVGDAATITSGTNAHPDADGPGDDREIADLGLGIPADLVDYASFRQAASELPGGVGGGLNRCKLGWIGPFDAQEAIEDILRPRGWCMSLKGLRFGLFSRATPLDASDAEVTISPADVAGAPDELPPDVEVDFRPLEPIDLVEARWGASQIGGDGRDGQVVVQARDARAMSRRSNARVDIEARSLLATGGWSLQELWGTRLASWYGEPHTMVTVAVKGDTARDLWPGTVVRFTSSWPATREGAYGMSARVGRVVSVSRSTQTLAATCEILVEGRPPTTRHRFGPIARLTDSHTTVEGRHDSGTRTLYCYEDAFGRDGTTSDVAGFTEPAWLGVGGRLKVAAWASWDGLTWEQTATFEVESVNTTSHTITYAAGTLSGTIWERRWTVLVGRPWDDQDPAEWPRELFGVLCGTDGKFGTGNEDGYPWVD